MGQKKSRTDLNKMQKRIWELTNFCNFLTSVPEIKRAMEKLKHGHKSAAEEIASQAKPEAANPAAAPKADG